MLPTSATIAYVFMDAEPCNQNFTSSQTTHLGCCPLPPSNINLPTHDSAHCRQHKSNDRHPIQVKRQHIMVTLPYYSNFLNVWNSLFPVTMQMSWNYFAYPLPSVWKLLPSCRWRFSMDEWHHLQKPGRSSWWKFLQALKVNTYLKDTLYTSCLGSEQVTLIVGVAGS